MLLGAAKRIPCPALARIIATVCFVRTRHRPSPYNPYAGLSQSDHRDADKIWESHSRNGHLVFQRSTRSRGAADWQSTRSASRTNLGEHRALRPQGLLLSGRARETYSYWSTFQNIAAERDLLNGDPSNGEVAITCDSVDRSERRQVGSYAARRITTTTTIAPSANSASDPARFSPMGGTSTFPDGTCA